MTALVGEILRLDWLTEADIFRTRQRARDVAAAVGLDRQDQVRVATAVSEIGRQLFGPEPSSVVFRVAGDPARLLVELSAPAPAGPGGALEESPAGRLVDSLEVYRGPDRVEVLLIKGLRRAPSVPETEQLRLALRAEESRSTPLEQLRVQNADLIETLEELRSRQRELAELNMELVSTNQGVLAMYSTLSAELDATNRGVVALYAELDESSRQLAEANDAKSRFLRSVSHELRAPVNAIIGLTGLLVSGHLDAEQRRQVDYVTASARTVLDLVNELLDLARAESGRLNIEVTEFELRPLLEELAATARPLLVGRGVAIVVDGSEPSTVACDRDLLTRVLRNLLTNALAFTVQGEISISARQASEGIVGIAVADTGIGIAPEHIESVFEEFFQVPNHLQSSRHGTGLGLAYARRVTRALGGDLELDSVPGVGSTFTVTLPAATGQPLEHPTEVRVGHVLLVDDDPAFRLRLRELLSGVAGKVSEAGDGAGAFAEIAAERPDLLLLDLRMPDRSGADLFAQLRSDPEPAVRDLPTILMTSVPIDEAVRRAAEPAAGLLSKRNLDRSGLTRAIARALGGREEL